MPDGAIEWASPSGRNPRAANRFITAGVLDNPELTWPKRFIGDDKPLGRVLRTSADVIDFARAA